MADYHEIISLYHSLYTEYSKNLLCMYQFLSYKWHFQAVSILDLNVMPSCIQNITYNDHLSSNGPIDIVLL